MRVLLTLELLYKKPIQWQACAVSHHKFFTSYGRKNLELVAYDLPAIFQKKTLKNWVRASSGDYSEEDTPVPIPNTEVKLFSADDTWRETARESRTSPDMT